MNYNTRTFFRRNGIQKDDAIPLINHRGYTPYDKNIPIRSPFNENFGFKNNGASTPPPKTFAQISDEAIGRLHSKDLLGSFRIALNNRAERLGNSPGSYAPKTRENPNVKPTSRNSVVLAAATQGADKINSAAMGVVHANLSAEGSGKYHEGREKVEEANAHGINHVNQVHQQNLANQQFAFDRTNTDRSYTAMQASNAANQHNREADFQRYAGNLAQQQISNNQWSNFASSAFGAAGAIAAVIYNVSKSSHYDDYRNKRYELKDNSAKVQLHGSMHPAFGTRHNPNAKPYDTTGIKLPTYDESEYSPGYLRNGITNSIDDGTELYTGDTGLDEDIQKVVPKLEFSNRTLDNYPRVVTQLDLHEAGKETGPTESNA